MRKKWNQSYSFTHFGTSLLLVILVVLCLTAFAALSLSGSLRDYEYSKKSADKTYDYYQADAKANQILREIHDILKESYRSVPNHYMKTALARLEELPDLTIDNEVICYTVSINEIQALEVKLQLYEPDLSHDTLYQITQWKEVSSKDWDRSSTLPVIGSD